MSKTMNKFAPEVRERAVRMVLNHERDHPSRWAAVVSIAEKIGCAPQTLVTRAGRPGQDASLLAQGRASCNQERGTGAFQLDEE